jgi:hypothetical protein
LPEAGKDFNSSKRSKGYLDEIGYDPERTQPDSPKGSVEKQVSIRQPGVRASNRRKISLRLIVIIVGIVLLISSTLFAVSTIESDESHGLQDTEEYQLFKAVLASDALNYNNGPGSSTFDSGKVMAADSDTVSESIIGENTNFDDYQFLIEIIDISLYHTHYNRTISENTAISTSPIPPPEDGRGVTTFEAGVNIFVRSDEIHTGKLIIHIWKV